MSLPPRDLVAWLYRSVAEHRLITGSAGNVSLRHGEGMLITPTGATGATARPARMVEMRFDGNHQGKVLPSSEWQMHAAIYRAAPQAMAIVHTHSDCATALACLGEPLPAFHYDVAGFGGTTVPLAAYATFGTAELAANVVRAMAGHSACLLANHGMICHAATAEAALAAALRLETLARQYLMARAAGAPVLLDAAAMRAVHGRYRNYGQQESKA